MDFLKHLRLGLTIRAAVAVAQLPQTDRCFYKGRTVTAVTGRAGRLQGLMGLKGRLPGSPKPYTLNPKP